MAPKPAFCQHCVELKRAFLQAVAEYRQLDTLEVEAVVAGREFCLSGELNLARRRRQETKTALITHSALHAAACLKSIPSKA